MRAANWQLRPANNGVLANVSRHAPRGERVMRSSLLTRSMIGTLRTVVSDSECLRSSHMCRGKSVQAGGK